MFSRSQLGVFVQIIFDWSLIAASFLSINMNSLTEDIAHFTDPRDSGVKTEEYLNNVDTLQEKIVSTKTVSVPTAIDPSVFYDHQKQFCLDLYRQYPQR